LQENPNNRFQEWDKLRDDAARIGKKQTKQKLKGKKRNALIDRPVPYESLLARN
jgi:hypothetical protein